MESNPSNFATSVELNPTVEPAPLPTPEAKEPRCKLLSRDATKYERQLAHKQKMARKARLRAMQGPTGKGLPVRANRSAKWDVVETEEASND